MEFKKSTAQLEKALKSICAFLNHKGGIIYFGVEKNGKIIGQTISDQTLRSVSQKIRQRIKPEGTPEIRVLEIEGKKIIEVKVKEGGNKPYYLEKIHRDSFCKQKRDVPEELGLIKSVGKKKGRYYVLV